MWYCYSRNAVGYALEFLLAIGLFNRLQTRLDHIEWIDREGSGGTCRQARQEGAPTEYIFFVYKIPCNHILN